MTFAGSVAGVFPMMEKAGLKPTGQRIYLDEVKFPATEAPKQWPPITGNSAHAAVSIRPDLDLLLAGKLNKGLKAFLKSAPKGPVSLLGLWHEASTHGPNGVYKNFVTGPKLKAAQKHVQKLAIGTDVRVGAIEVVPGKNLAEWMAEDLDFYACDIYDDKAGNARPYEMLGVFRGTCDKLMPKGRPAVIGVTETNSRHKQRRPFWFQTVWSWLQTRGMTSNDSCFLTYWRRNALESGAWLPHDKPTIDVLKTIFEHSRP